MTDTPATILREFLIDWSKASSEEYPKAAYRRYGLCFNLRSYTDDYLPSLRNRTQDLLYELIENYPETGPDLVYPFGGLGRYQELGQNGLQHTDPERKEFVKWALQQLQSTK